MSSPKEASKEQPATSATSAPTHAAVAVNRPPVVATSPPRYSPISSHHHHHHHARSPPHPTSPIASPRRNLVPTVVPRPAGSCSPSSYGVRTRSQSLDHPPPFPVVNPLAAAAAAPRSVPHSPVSGAAAALSHNSPAELTVPFLAGPQPQPPEPSEARKAMEMAVAKERQRAKQMEENHGEATMSADEIRAVLKAERKRMAKMAGDLAVLKLSAVQLQLEAEVKEEGRINGLWRQMDHLQQEKGRVILELEREEEMLTNTLQKKLDEVRQEKRLLEEQIEREKTANTTLQTQLSDLRNSHLTVAEHLEEEDEIEEEY